MKRAAVARIVLFLCLMGSGMFGTSAGAVSTIPTDFLQEIPLQISAYGWRLNDTTSAYDAVNNPRILEYVQLYNDSDKLIDIRDWRIVFSDISSGTPVELPIEMHSEANGWLAPAEHVAMSYGAAVQAATFSIDNEVILTNLATSSSSKVKLTVRSTTESLYRDADYWLKLDSISATASYWQRSFSSTGEGYTTTFSALTAAPTQLFDDGLYTTPGAPLLRIVEIYPYGSDCAPDDTSILCGDYVKLRVEGATNLSNYMLRTDSNSSSRTTSNTMWLGAYAPNSDGYITVHLTDDNARVSLTNSGGYIWLEDVYGISLYTTTMTGYVSAASEHQGWAWALENGIWQWTSTPQPDTHNLITVPPEETTVCPAGKYLNPDTGRCRTIEEAVNALASCPEGQVRNPATNRCRQVVTTASSLVPCGEGQERNPATNRCRSIALAVAELIPCDEGYDRNPATNRCRKIAGITTTAATTNLPDTTTTEPAAMQQWGWVLVAVAATGAIGYGIYEWRTELIKGWRWIVTKVGR